MAAAALLCVAAARAVGKGQRSTRGGVRCRVVAVSSGSETTTIRSEPPVQAAAAPVDLLATPSYVPHVQPCAQVAPADASFGAALASEVVSSLHSITDMKDSAASQSPTFGRSTPRGRAARRVGAARCAGSRGSRRGAIARAAHRRVGATLQRSQQAPAEVAQPSYDASRVRAKIQLGLQTACRQRLQRGREFCTAASSESVSNLIDSYTAMSNFLNNHLTSNIMMKCVADATWHPGVPPA